MMRNMRKGTRLAVVTLQHSRRHLTGHTAAPGARKTAVLFPGQGAQHVGMGADIYENFKAARDVIDASDEAVGGGLKKLMFEGPQQTLTSTENAQPAILCHSIALLKVLETEFGFDINSCTYALGHSLGEYSALVATQSLSLSDAIKLVRLRGEAMHRSVDSGKTTMKALIINGDHLEDIEALMSKIERSLPEGEVAQIANINSRSQVVLSGTSKGVDYACSIIQTKGYAGRALGLPVSAPFHCDLMQPAADEMKPALDGASFNDPTIEVISNVTGMPLGNATEIQSLLHQQITKTVQWQRSIRYAKDDDVHDWVVIGPSRVLANLLRKEFPTDAIRAVATAEDVQQHGPHLCRRKR
ncbi:malonyl CoA-acyl carrier protein transacylase [Spizellomyces punctatus DAOM BR117]|uniref:[acyl-carrier-protein] S-malonyltransferase n=1 Tax=Spizellomyces punctatus (strain DAOM BR117) TaxID=645134 RepID=A0A0L0H954_SPIPD|nr:malonyl CoA-acyl carrier protein transacylase [Spizellomyces punctatus DAOM BR117]KNC97469.1 malonyl CoA-acyl carrier protein transacylase [Spizellomyces punctatus DAOM BR117]|eukprot:XP_016605509.1 malonyl CoA-acyl carrier protein transacylase [Spizellomyces punctatus DAOM BR117]